uniref:LRR receptor-like serine/threonine-protein kinase GSO1 n=1 Tax=Cajanus cajan TaxID=3821 RepID=A0A151RH31_CAJCA|nr:LRR receptor-like serine/threonine-protein kinase GSO1 [Cajanus cajan]
MRLTLVSLFSFFLLYLLYLSTYFSVTTGRCLEDQQSLLLQLKNNLTFNPEDSTKLKLWSQSIDCCDWSGVTCNNEGHVIGLDLSGELISGGFDDSSVVFSLQHLQKLNLAANNFSSVIPSGFNKLEKLTYLNLSYAGFVGQIPIEISQLTRLITLDISSLSFLTGQELKLENPNLPKLVQNLTSVRQLYLDGVSVTVPGHEWCNALLLLHDLQELSMSHCNLSGPLDPSLTGLGNLSVIVLDQNNLSSPVPETFAHLKNLTILSLVYCGLTGTFPQDIFSIGTLSVIDISLNNNLHGFFPDFPPGGSLRTLRVSNTSFSGEFPHSIRNMRNLSELDFSYCRFNGTLPSSLSNLTELSYLDLSYNNITGQMPSFEMAKKLTYLDLSNNGLSGAIPPSSHFEGLNNLVSIDLGYNSINGIIPASLFTLPQLQRILLSHNQFGQLGEFKNVSSSKLNILDLSSNNLSGPFPTSIFQLSTLSILQLSSNKFNGSMHLNKLLGLKNLTTLDLSYNNLSADVNVTNLDRSSFPSIRPLQNLSSNLYVLDLHFNKLQGPVPVFPKYATYLDYSGNKFNSFIPQDIGKYLSFTIFFSLSNNNLSGSIPDSLCNASYLQVLDLSHNNISGTIPSCLMTMVACALRTLNLHHNKLDGKIPKSLSNCTTLEVLDLGNNNIMDAFPCLLKNISTLRVLVLRKNKFYGEIPEELFDFKALYILNLSKNSFSGQIPSSIGNLKDLESLDLSNNSLEGNIPAELATLSFLSFLNLSFNHLSGKIPTGTQIQSFLETSFIGNKGLCGPPLTKCTANISPATTESTMKFDWQYMCTGIGFGVGAGVIVPTMMIWERGRKWSNHSIDQLLVLVFPLFGLVYTPIEDDVDDDDDAEEKDDDSSKEEDNWDYLSFRGRYCVFCSKLDITMKKVIHDPSCTCYPSSSASDSSHSSKSYSPQCNTT